MGRPSTTNSQRKSKGYYRPSRHGVDAPAEPSSPLPKPDDLTDAVSAEWDRLMVVMVGRVSAEDAIQFRELAEWGAELGRLREELRATEPISKEYGKLLYATETASRAFDRVARRFGTDPTGRKGLPSASESKPTPRVATRPKTKLDRSGGPKS